MRIGCSPDVQGKVRCEADVRVAGDLFSNGTLSIHEATTIGGDLIVKGKVQCGRGIRTGGAIKCLDELRTGQGIESAGSIFCHGHLEANWGIKSGECILSNGNIKAGESLKAGEEIQAGEGYGVFAGLAIPFAAWEISAQVQARTRPRHLMIGWWMEDAPDSIP